MSYEINAEMMDEIINELENWDIECTPFPKYSGRRMNGAECVGFVTNNVFGVGMCIDYVARQMEWEDIGALAADATYDDMAMSTIVYFPSFTTDWVEPDEDES